MNAMFMEQIGRNMEFYVENMLVKIPREDENFEDLEETFKVLRKYRIKLNPTKWAFGVLVGKFLGFMVS